MGNGAALGAMLIGVLIALALGMLLNAVILRAAVSLYNKLAGGADSPKAVQEPTVIQAMGITFVTMLVNGVAGFMIGGAIGVAFVGQISDRDLKLIAQLVSLPISFLIMAAMLSALLPTTFGRAMLVALFDILIALAIVVTLFAIMAIVVLVFARAA